MRPPLAVPWAESELGYVTQERGMERFRQMATSVKLSMATRQSPRKTDTAYSSRLTLAMLSTER
ncbi:hypothetical protein Ciccas_012083 [Cichlidogyrus casuarinus]|uniref:Uncharacterized protein n=1 Tax=Cichlidogyrus casuarinus TaxID=1844966 RepID=A0ABD2PQB2_9PLAT